MEERTGSRRRQYFRRRSKQEDQGCERTDKSALPADWTAQGREGFFRERVGALDVKQRRAVVNRLRPSFSMVRQCKLLDISRSGLYYQPAGVSDKDLNLMKLIDRQYMARPFYGSRKLAAWLKSEHYSVNRKHVRRLMQLMGLKAIYRRPRTSPPGPGNKIYPYLLNGIQITRPNQVWCADITNTPFLNHSQSGLPRLTLA
jgi:putative transposase